MSANDEGNRPIGHRALTRTLGCLQLFWNRSRQHALKRLAMASCSVGKQNKNLESVDSVLCGKTKSCGLPVPDDSFAGGGNATKLVTQIDY